MLLKPLAAPPVVAKEQDVGPACSGSQLWQDCIQLLRSYTDDDEIIARLGL